MFGTDIENHRAIKVVGVYVTITANRLTSSPMLHPDTEVQPLELFMMWAVWFIRGLLRGSILCSMGSIMDML